MNLKIARTITLFVLLVMGIGLTVSLRKCQSPAHCVVEFSGLRPFERLERPVQRRIHIQSVCKGLKVSGHRHSEPLKARFLSEALPTDILLSAESEGIGQLGVSISDSAGREVGSTSFRVEVRPCALYKPRLQQATSYYSSNGQILRASLSLNHPAWKSVDPYTVRLWLIDNEWRVQNRKAIQVRLETGLHKRALPKHFCARFAGNSWIFDFELPPLTKPPAYILIVGGGLRGQPGEFDFECLAPYRVVRESNLPYTPPRNLHRSPATASNPPCRWRWWYGEQVLEEETLQKGASTSGNRISATSRWGCVVIDKKHPFHWASRCKGLLIFWHESPVECQPSVDCSANADYHLSEGWNKGGIGFSSAELRASLGAGVASKSLPSLSAYEYQIAYALNLRLDSGDHPAKTLQSRFALCSHSTLQHPFGIDSQNLLKRLPATLPIHGVHSRGALPLEPLLGRATSDHTWNYAAGDWLSVSVELTRYYYFSIRTNSDITKAIVHEDNSILVCMLARCNCVSESVVPFHL